MDNYEDLRCHFGWQLQSPEQMSNKRRLFAAWLPLKTVDFGVDRQFGQIRVHWWIVIGVPQFAMNFAVPSCGFVSPSTEILPYNRYCRYSIPFHYRKFPSFTRFGGSSVGIYMVISKEVRSKGWCPRASFRDKTPRIAPNSKTFPKSVDQFPPPADLLFTARSTKIRGLNRFVATLDSAHV